MKKIRMSNRIFFLLGFCLTVISAVFFYQNQKALASPKKFPGTVKAQTICLKAPHTGKLNCSDLKDGTFIERGKEIFKIDDDVLHAQKEYALALVSQLEKEENLKKICIEETMQEYIESRRLQKEQPEIDRQVVELQKAQASYEVVRANLLATQKQQALFEAQVDHQKVCAPFDAIVLDTFQKNGEWSQEGQQVVSLYNPSSFYVELSVEENDILLDPLHPFATIAVQLEDTLKEFKGRVKKVEKCTSSKNIYLEISLDSSDTSFLQPEMPAQVTFFPQ